MLGTNFFNGPGLSCQFVGTVKREVKAVWKSSTWIMCVTPPVASTLKIKVEVTNNGQDFTNNGVVYTFQTAALVLGMQPSTGPVQGRIRVTVTGAHFTHAPQLSCRFEQTVAPALTLINSTAAVCGVPTSSVAECVEVAISNNGVDFSGNLLHFCYIGRRCPSMVGPLCKSSSQRALLSTHQYSICRRQHGRCSNPAFLWTTQWQHIDHHPRLRVH